MKIGLLRPITLFPFPKKEIYDLALKNCKFLVVEMSNGQMVEDVRLSTQGKTSVDLYNRMGGVVPTTDEIIEHIQNRFIFNN
jgi:pyruvate/2-oxoacid:ferredoxin oxidoreductase alpha subunit